MEMVLEPGTNDKHLYKCDSMANSLMVPPPAMVGVWISLRKAGGPCVVRGEGLAWGIRLIRGAVCFVFFSTSQSCKSLASTIHFHRFILRFSHLSVTFLKLISVRHEPCKLLAWRMPCRRSILHFIHLAIMKRNAY